jgi:hypothetical protein
VDDNSATVFFANPLKLGNRVLVEWTLWQFAVCQLQDYPRCIARGQYSIPFESILYVPIERVDDKRKLVYWPMPSNSNSDSEGHGRQELLTFAVIPTEPSHTDTDKHEMTAPVWSLYVGFMRFVVFLACNQVMLLFNHGWTLYNLADGTRIWHMDKQDWNNMYLLSFGRMRIHVLFALVHMLYQGNDIVDVSTLLIIFIRNALNN